MIPLLFWDISVCLICKLHIWHLHGEWHIGECYISFLLLNKITSKCTCLVLWEEHMHMITSKWFCFITAKIHVLYTVYITLSDMSFPMYYIMCNLHIKETELSQKLSKGIKNWKITYSVILSVLSNKTNLILGFSSPLSI